jgi:hypothetical protein
VEITDSQGRHRALLIFLSEGTLTATDIAVGDTTYEDVVLQPDGSYVGERALVTESPGSQCGGQDGRKWPLYRQRHLFDGSTAPSHRHASNWCIVSHCVLLFYCSTVLLLCTVCRALGT